MLPLANEGGQGGGTAFILPHAHEIFWAAVVLLLILLVVGRYALPRLYAVLDERARRIQEGLDLADKAKQDQADAEKRAARLVDEARREAAASVTTPRARPRRSSPRPATTPRRRPQASSRVLSVRSWLRSRPHRSLCAPTSACSPPPWPSASSVST